MGSVVDRVILGQVFSCQSHHQCSILIYHQGLVK
jgi:hypothetical protein